MAPSTFFDCTCIYPDRGIPRLLQILPVHVFHFHSYSMKLPLPAPVFGNSIHCCHNFCCSSVTMRGNDRHPFCLSLPARAQTTCRFFPCWFQSGRAHSSNYQTLLFRFLPPNSLKRRTSRK